MGKRSLLSVAAALTAAPGWRAEGAPVAWTCPAAQSRAQQLWINEVHYASASALDRAVEVLAFDASLIAREAANISLVVLDGSGAVVGQRALGACLFHEGLAQPWGARAWVCTDLGDLRLDRLASTGGGGLALVRAPSNPGGNPSVLQYIGVGTVVPYRGVEPCVINIDVQELVEGVAGTSLQLVSLATGLAPTAGGAQWAAAPHALAGGWTDVTRFLGWEAGLPITFGVENAGLLPTGGEYVQVFRLPTPPEVAAGVVAPVVYDPPASLPPSPPGGNTTDCGLGGVTEWSKCSLTCLPLSSAGGGATAGTQVRWQPVVTLPGGGGAACPPLWNRSETRPCAPTPICTGCENLRVDGVEADVDCGGGATDAALVATLPPSATIHDVVRALFTQRGAGVVQQPSPPRPGACGRCSMGRACSQHSDCAWSEGLVCAPGVDVCTPWRVLNATSFVRVVVALRGADPTGGASGAALASLTSLFAGLASGNGNILVPANVTIVRVDYRPGGQGDAVVPSVTPNTFRRALQGGDAPHSRGLAQAADSLSLTVLIAAPDSFQAGVMASGVNARRGAGASVAEEALRPTSPLVTDVTLSQASVVDNPFGTAEGVTPPGNGGGVRPLPGTTTIPASAAPSGRLSGGAIAGVVLGAAAGLALLAAAVVAGVQKTRAAAAERGRAEDAAAARRTGRGINIRETAGVGGGDAPPSLLPALAAKATFAPRHANRVSEGAEAPTEALPPASPTEALPPASSLVATKPEFAPAPGGRAGEGEVGSPQTDPRGTEAEEGQA